VRELVVRPDFQGRGIGTAVVRDAIARGRARRVPVMLGTLQENRAADLYRRLGFVEYDRTDTHILFRLGP
jgi:ribosomal protein S18 acetylase RimI-like enzyme